MFFKVTHCGGSLYRGELHFPHSILAQTMVHDSLGVLAVAAHIVSASPAAQPPVAPQAPDDSPSASASLVARPSVARVIWPSASASPVASASPAAQPPVAPYDFLRDNNAIWKGSEGDSYVTVKLNVPSKPGSKQPSCTKHYMLVFLDHAGQRSEFQIQFYGNDRRKRLSPKYTKPTDGSFVGVDLKSSTGETLARIVSVANEPWVVRGLSRPPGHSCFPRLVVGNATENTFHVRAKVGSAIEIRYHTETTRTDFNNTDNEQTLKCIAVVKKWNDYFLNLSVDDAPSEEFCAKWLKSIGEPPVPKKRRTD